ncbi:TPA: hypothetical protein DEP96_02775 [Candidatus Uhrbacteria bacterium]|nr:hypothetical protein [Candidatus Uhrbacteria bacterium]
MAERIVWPWVVGSLTVVALAIAIFIISMINTPPPGTTVTPGATNPPDTSSGNNPNTGTGTTAKQPFIITTMTHMEGVYTDDVNEKVFEKHVADMRWAMDLFDEYGAKLTFESEQSFAKANTNWGLNILKEAVDRGHGVGTHADFGAKAGLSLAQLTQNFVNNKKLVDGLVGAINNQGVSGGTGPTDWVLAATAAGFHYIDAVTGFGYLSMPTSARPSNWTNSYIISTGYHDSVPPKLEDRIYPIPLKDAQDFVPDAGAALTMMSGDLGELSSLAEGRSNCSPNCTFDQSDINVVVESIDDILAYRDTSRFTKINFHIPMDLLVKSNETKLRTMLTAIKKYTDAGTLAWDTQLGAYKEYISSIK